MVYATIGIDMSPRTNLHGGRWGDDGIGACTWIAMRDPQLQWNVIRGPTVLNGQSSMKTQHEDMWLLKGYMCAWDACAS